MSRKTISIIVIFIFVLSLSFTSYASEMDILLDKLTEKGLAVSMTEANHCYENAMAERVNGILKQEYELDYAFKTKEQAQAAFYQAVDLYNTRRPHMSLNYRIPAEVHEKAA